MNARLFACALALVLAGCEQAPPSAAEVESFLRQYVAASNASDVAKTMSFIQKDEVVTSAGLGKVHRGWDAIRAATADGVAQEARVKLTLGIVVVSPVAREVALAVGPISVATSKPVQLGRAVVSSATGAVSFVVKRTPEGLRIVHEHYSLVPL